MNESPPSVRTIEEIAEAAQTSYRTVEEMVVAAIREAVLSGVYGPGEKLPQEQLAQALGVSRIPVRSALRQLEAEGLVAFAAHRGATVRALDPAEVEEIYELRILLETFALEAAIELITPDQLDELESIADRIDRTEEGADWLELREDFYDRLYTIAKRPLTGELIAKLRNDVGRYWLSVRLLDHGSGGHRVIVDAMRRGDPAAAEAWLTEHLTEVSRELRRRLATESEGTT
jgi:DNA-binding GntR family transcriptional regulator